MKEHRELQTLIDELERHITHQCKEVERLHEENKTLKKCLFQMQNAAIELAKPEQKFYPDWDMIKPYHERIKELEVQLVKAGVMR
jgi:uncharacterized coiled-coil protein SlyX